MKILLTLIGVLTILTFCFVLFTTSKFKGLPLGSPTLKDEFENQEKVRRQVPALKAHELVSDAENVYFIISKFEINGRPINARQACGMESAAMYHPERNIFVLIVTPDGVSPPDIADKEPADILSKYYPNVKLRTINLKRFLTGTPMELLLQPLQESEHQVEHSSDVLRYTILYRYPGVYLDTDVILLKPLPPGENYIGVESDNWIGAGIMSFGKDRVGREVAEESARQLIRWFDGNQYASSGPKVVTRALFNRCKASTRGSWVLAKTGRLCEGFQIFPSTIFYGLPMEKRLAFFTKGQTPQMERLINGSISVHYWNHLTSDLKANESNIPFYDIAEHHCPYIFRHAGHMF